MCKSTCGERVLVAPPNSHHKTALEAKGGIPRRIRSDRPFDIWNYECFESPVRNPACPCHPYPKLFDGEGPRTSRQSNTRNDHESHVGLQYIGVAVEPVDLVKLPTCELIQWTGGKGANVSALASTLVRIEHPSERPFERFF